MGGACARQLVCTQLGEQLNWGLLQTEGADCGKVDETSSRGQTSSSETRDGDTVTVAARKRNEPISLANKTLEKLGPNL